MFVLLFDTVDEETAIASSVKAALTDVPSPLELDAAFFASVVEVVKLVEILEALLAKPMN